MTSLRKMTIQLPSGTNSKMEDAMRTREDYGKVDVSIIRNEIINEALTAYLGLGSEEK